ncbi:acetyltransferase [Streptomyces sp. CB02923]|uniref:GNAT family N-acetyltransferase n=1 Tax=Streptomyces sp. CB02923 TaxID=1718985 RepID=UPI00093F6907|nr:N-acetyltransferase [Streptomyces sp. CB02923]OKI04978.1 acetyltransferase [Streptomyces sp. CB02923]
MNNWQCRPETPEDIPAVRRVNLAAFETAGEADLVDALRRDPAAWLPGLSYVAGPAAGSYVTESAAGPSGRAAAPAPEATPVDAPVATPVVAHALLTRCHISGEPAVALAPCAVLPEYHKQGAGSAVIRALLDAARAAGERTAVVLGHPPYYPRFGFEPASRFGILPPQEWPDEAFLALSLDGGAPPRGTVRYAEAFGIE